MSISTGPVSHITAQAHRYLHAAETVVSFDPAAAGRAADIGLRIIGDEYASFDGAGTTGSQLAAARAADARGDTMRAASLRIWVLAARIQLLNGR